MSLPDVPALPSENTNGNYIPHLLLSMQQFMTISSK